jgi:hypothetical protein
MRSGKSYTAMKVVRKKLGREKAWGMAHPGDNIIEIDPTLKGRKVMEILIHEALHLLNPEWTEAKVVRQSKKLTKLLWSEHFRKVDNDRGQRLQS